MIILIDNKDYMIKLCKNSPDIHGFDTSFPCWHGFMKLYSDTGMMSVVSGKEAEEYLDKNNIYYVHIEDEGESYKEFLLKTIDALKDNEELEKVLAGKEVVKYNRITNGISFGVRDYYYDWEF